MCSLGTDEITPIRCMTCSKTINPDEPHHQYNIKKRNGDGKTEQIDIAAICDKCCQRMTGSGLQCIIGAIYDAHK